MADDTVQATVETPHTSSDPTSGTRWTLDQDDDDDNDDNCHNFLVWLHSYYVLVAEST